MTAAGPPAPSRTAGNIGPSERRSIPVAGITAPAARVRLSRVLARRPKRAQAALLEVPSKPLPSALAGRPEARTSTGRASPFLGLAARVTRAQPDRASTKAMRPAVAAPRLTAPRKVVVPARPVGLVAPPQVVRRGVPPSLSVRDAAGPAPAVP